MNAFGKLTAAYTRMMDIIVKIMQWFLIGVLGIMTLSVFISVVTRYAFAWTMPWSDPVARYGQTWIMLLGSSLALRKGMHIGIENFVNLFPPLVQQTVRRINVLLIFVFSAAMLVQGFKLIEIAKDQLIPELGIPMQYIYYMIPTGGGLLILTCVELLLRARIGSMVASE
ncbi:MAG: TRAP transporter small permease [Spirochaetales bacterium]|jgi:C4-dicarboxylate transporter DctQ subunit|nr:TRAP transporter small permease [Spirochaetales bacterium]